jgi:hypothetical protein
MDSPTRKARPAIRETDDADEKESLLPTDRTRLTAPLDATESAASTFFGWRMDTEAGAEKERASEARRVSMGLPDDDAARVAPMIFRSETDDAEAKARESGLVVPPAEAVKAAIVADMPEPPVAHVHVGFLGVAVVSMSSATPKVLHVPLVKAWCARTVNPESIAEPEKSDGEPTSAAAVINNSFAPAGVIEPGATVTCVVFEFPIDVSSADTPE